MLFRAASIFCTFIASASFFRVLRFPRFDSSKMHSCPPDLQRYIPVSLVRKSGFDAGLRTLQGPLGPVVSSGMHRILIFRHLHQVSG